MTFFNILLVLDTRHPGQERALCRAAAFARTEGAHLTVCEIVDWVLPEVPRYINEGTVRVLTDTIRANKLERLEKLVATNAVSGLNIAVNVSIGKPHIEIARLVRENQHDLVVKPSVRRAGTTFFSFVQEDRALIRNCPCPVWLINVAEQDDKGCVLAALDMPSGGGSTSVLNQNIVQISRSIALAESRPLHFVHAWSLRGEGHMRSRRTPAADLEADRMLAWESARRKTWLQKSLAATRSGVRSAANETNMPEFHVLQGHAEKVIPDLAEKLGAGLIVMGSAARRRPSGFVRRNTAEKILRRSASSMLFVRQPESLSMHALNAKRALRVGHRPPAGSPNLDVLAFGEQYALCHPLETIVVTNQKPRPAKARRKKTRRAAYSRQVPPASIQPLLPNTLRI